MNAKESCHASARSALRRDALETFDRALSLIAAIIVIAIIVVVRY